MAFLHRLSIRTQLIIITQTLLLLVLVIGGAAVSYWDERIIEKAAVDKARAIANAFSPTFVRMMVLDSVDAAADTTAALESFHDLLDVYVFNLQKKPVYQFHREANNQYTIPKPFDTEVITTGKYGPEVNIPLYFQGNRYGTLYFNLSSKAFNQWASGHKKILAITGISLLFLALVLAYVGQRIISRPIIRLSEVMQYVRDTGDYQARVDIYERNEIGTMVDSFHAMLQQVVSSQRDLKDQKFALDVAAIVSITDANGNIIYVNKKFIKSTGKKKEDLLGKNHRILKSDVHSEAFFKELWQIIARGEVWHGEICNMDGEQQHIWLNTTIVPFLDEQGVPYQYLAIRYDITDRKLMESALVDLNVTLEQKVKERSAALEISNKRLMEAEKMAALGGLVAGVAHEINTPVGIGITAISHFNGELTSLREKIQKETLSKNDLDNFIEQSCEISTIILNNLQRSAQLVKSFKMVAADQTTLERREFKLAKYLEEIILSLRSQLNKTPYTIEVNCPVDMQLDSYPGAYSQIITKFILNSLNYAFIGDTHQGKMTITAIENHGQLRLVYEDDGIGMSEEVLNKAFDPFFTTGRQIGGTGLGLHIVYNLVTQTLGGYIQCESTSGEGVRFQIDVPLNIPQCSTDQNNNLPQAS